jgi:starch synthase
MRILLVSSEVFPLAKTGGLADVSGALPAALAGLGLDARVLMPGYPQAMEMALRKRKVAALGSPLGLGETTLVQGVIPGSEVPLWLIDCPALYARSGGPYQDEHGRDWPDNPLRFALLSWVAARLGQKATSINWQPAILHANDWQAGLAAAYLHAWGGDRPGTVLTIHNIAYQGLFAPDILPRIDLPWSMYGIDGLEFYGHASYLKAGVFYSDKLTTVSPSYAREIQTADHGCGLEGLLAHRAADLVGILNGADYGVWDPATDPHIAKRHAPGDLSAKAANKAALQRELGLPESPDAPLLVVVSRLNEHKGMDMVLATLPVLLHLGAQLAVLGTGDKPIEEAFQAAAAANPRQVAVRIGYSEPLAHRMQAGADMLLMPSRSEPCGLTQFYAFRYGTLPVVHRTGGLADSVLDASYDALMTGEATGFVFDQPTASALQWCLERAVALYRQPPQWKKLRKSAMAQDFGWAASAKRYRDLYRSLRPAAFGKGRRRA